MHRNLGIPTRVVALAANVLVSTALLAAEYHVSVQGNDAGDGSAARMFRTISAAARLAQPGDTITVHEGVYRERVAPPRGGLSDEKRITYQAAPGEKVVITGSEVMKGWEKAGGDTWKVVVPNKFFGDFNPYGDLIRGDWFAAKGRQHHTGAVYLHGHWLIEAANLDAVLKPAGATPLWYAKVDATAGATTIWAQFPGVNPNEAQVEINVRPTVFTPEKEGVDYITLRGFTLRNAATNWAPPTAAQIGLVSAFWSKGWIIENNDIAYSKCSGIALGKYGDEWDNRAGTAEGYVGTLNRALKHGWNRATVGSHTVRNNHIAHCEQTGVVGSLGCSFSTVTGNEIHDIHVHRLFGGAEMAGIKFHGAIDVVIRGNHIYRCGDVSGIWLDWMAQGAQVTGNLLHDNTGHFGDVFSEMQHGPMLFANNVFLSGRMSFALNAQGMAVAQNLITGPINNMRNDKRVTPYQLAHSTAVGGMHPAGKGDSGDHRFYNNLFLAPCNAGTLDKAALPCFCAGNVFTKGSQPSRFDRDAIAATEFDPAVKLTERGDGWYLELTLDKGWATRQPRKLVTTELLGMAKVPNLPFENPDGSPVRLDTDYFGKKRSQSSPFPGPFEAPEGGRRTFRVWPIGEGEFAK